VKLREVDAWTPGVPGVKECGPWVGQSACVVLELVKSAE